MKNYVVHSKIGRGKYSHVFDGTDKKTGKRVAVKVLVPIRKDKIKREYHILNSLNHPNVGRLL
jgi:casein kinase II subunit alpha